MVVEAHQRIIYWDKFTRDTWGSIFVSLVLSFVSFQDMLVIFFPCFTKRRPCMPPTPSLHKDTLQRTSDLPLSCIPVFRSVGKSSLGFLALLSLTTSWKFCVSPFCHSPPPATSCLLVLLLSCVSRIIFYTNRTFYTVLKNASNFF